MTFRALTIWVTVAVFASAMSLMAIPVFAQGETSEADAELLIWPDPLYMEQGRTGLFEIRFQNQGTPIYELRLLLNISGVGAEIENVYVVGAPDLYLIDRADNTGQVKLIFRSEGGYRGNGTIARILVRVPTFVQSGSRATLEFDVNTSALDVAGNKLPLGARDSAINIRAEVIDISSSSHPDEGAWYSRRDADIGWEFAGERAYSYRITKILTQRPDTEANEPTGAITLRELQDGAWYFLLCELKEGGGCDALSNRRIMIDSTAPEEFSVEFERPENGIVAVFNPYDATSGIAYTEIALNPEAVESGDVGAWELADSPYRLKRGLVRDIMVKAVDNAGNERIVRVPAPSYFSDTVYLALAAVAFFLLMAGGLSALHGRHTKHVSK